MVTSISVAEPSLTKDLSSQLLIAPETSNTLKNTCLCLSVGTLCLWERFFCGNAFSVWMLCLWERFPSELEILDYPQECWVLLGGSFICLPCLSVGTLWLCLRKVLPVFRNALFVYGNILCLSKIKLCVNVWTLFSVKGKLYLWKCLTQTISWFGIRSLSVYTSVFYVCLYLERSTCSLLNTQAIQHVRPGNTKGGKYHCTIDLLFDWFGISCITPDNSCFYLQTDYSKPIKQEVNGTMILPPLVFPGPPKLD